jgi:hypothetical protein
MISEISKLRSSIEYFKNQDQLDITNFKLPTYEHIIEDQSKRRSSATMLIIAIPILIALISVNTGMLSKFFEGLVDEYLSYSLGIKLSQVLAFFFSLLEVALGVFFYYAGKHRSSVSLATPLILTVVLLFITGLGIIESFLYLSLSAQTAKISLSQIQSLTGLAFFEAVWLTPMGFIIVGSLALIGHMLIKGLDDFRDSGQTISIKDFLEKIEKGSQAFNENLEKIFQGIKKNTDSMNSYDAKLAAVQNKPNWLQTTIEEALQSLEKEIQDVSKGYNNSWSQEARILFYAKSALSIACFIALGAFVAIMGHNLITIQTS